MGQCFEIGHTPLTFGDWSCINSRGYLCSWVTDQNIYSREKTRGRLRDLVGSALDHRSLLTQFEYRRRHI